MDNKKIGAFISELRKEQGLNQKELADKLSITDKAISKWETGRGIPDISLLQPLSEIFGVTITELLNGERIPVKESLSENSDKLLIKKLKTKKYIRLAIELIITIACCYYIYMLRNTFSDFMNIVDISLHQNEIYFLTISTIIFIIAFVIWVITVIVSAIFKKKASVLKTIIICLTFSFVIASAVNMAQMEDNRYSQMLDTPVDTISYIKYDDFFNDDFTTQITLKDTNETITENYSAYFDSPFDSDENNFVYTKCITASEYDIVKAYMDQRKPILTHNASSTDLTDDICSFCNISEGYYITKLYGENSISLYFIKGNSYYEIDISDCSLNDKLLTLLKEL